MKNRHKARQQKKNNHQSSCTKLLFLFLQSSDTLFFLSVVIPRRVSLYSTFSKTKRITKNMIANSGGDDKGYGRWIMAQSERRRGTNNISTCFLECPFYYDESLAHIHMNGCKERAGVLVGVCRCRRMSF